MKQVTKTPQIIEHLKAAFGAEVDPNGYAVYEAIALNQNPIRQKHPLFKGAVAQDSLLRELVAEIGKESAPLQLQHKGGELPSGRVFHAELAGGEVRALFALTTKPENAGLIADLDAGIIDQVSVNLMAKSLQCSHAGCGWDYLGPDADFRNIMNGECANEHKLREGGTHIRLEGLDYLAEISLVGSGGADGARIVGKDNQFFASDSAQRLAASGLAPAMLLASITPSATPAANPKGTHDMDMTALVAAAAEDKAKVITLTAEVTAQTALVAAANTTIAERDTTIADLNAKLEAANATAAPSQTVLDFIKDAATKALIAKGDQNPTVPESVEDQIAAITAAGVMLSMIPAGGAAKTGVADAEKTPVSPASAAFSRAK